GMCGASRLKRSGIRPSIGAGSPAPHLKRSGIRPSIGAGSPAPHSRRTAGGTMHLKTRTILLAAAVAAAALLPAAGAFGDQPPIKIGFITSYSGSTASAARISDATL